MKIRLLSRDDVCRALSLERAIELMSDAFRSLSDGTVEAPVRTRISNEFGTLLYKPCAMQAAHLFGAKVVSVFPGNPERGRAVTSGVMLVNDGRTGYPLALMDAEYLTALRTAAAAGLATRLLSIPESEAAALFGTGGQAFSQLQALLAAGSLRTIHVFSRHPENAIRFCDTHAAVAGQCRLVPGIDRGVLRECQIISTVTSSKFPLFHDDEISPGTHLNGMGSFTPDAAEIPADTVCRATVFVDHRAAALSEAGDLLQPVKEGRLPNPFEPAEIGEVLSGKRPGRTRPDEITFFKSVGNAAQDIVCAAEILDVANQNGLGQFFDFA